MKKSVFIPLLAMLSVSSVWAQQEYPAPSVNPAGNESVTTKNEHELAILAHQSMNNASSAAHQSIIDMHRKMMQQEQ
ncbi:hypothetical protein WKH55_22140 [Pantoea agglomerans]|uniref:hypothetical protein n=1 Tax=Pantoea TaxID=53335 RepID=UPI00142D7C32|nr:hypothetical protein [Pantoea sp. EKM20T]KAF6677128.1 hypothetical protein HFD94_19740 [Pantoea sp. EKM20T]